MTPEEIIAKEMRDRDAKRATAVAWMQVVLAQTPWDKCSEAAKSNWTDDVKAGLKKLREASGGVAWVIMPDGSLKPLGPTRSADPAGNSEGDRGHG